MGSAGREQQVPGIAPDHVEVDVHHHRVLRTGGALTKARGTVQAELLGVERGEDDRVFRRLGGEPRGNREHRRNARRVVVGAVEHLSLDDAEMVVVGGDDDEASWLAAAANHGDEVDAGPIARAAAAAEREGLLERLAIRGRQLRRLEAAQDYSRALADPGVPTSRPSIESADRASRSLNNWALSTDADCAGGRRPPSRCEHERDDRREPKEPPSASSRCLGCDCHRIRFLTCPSVIADPFLHCPQFLPSG